MSLIVRLIFATLALLTAPAWAAQSFEYWLSQEVAPDLVNKFSHHPKFKGYDLAARKVDDQLAANIVEELSHQLLANNAANVLPPAAGPACYPASNRFYHLDVQTTKIQSDMTKIRIRIKDPSTDIWLRGFSHNWQGRLSRARQNQLKRTVSGTLGSKTTPASPDNLAKALIEQLACADLPHGTFTITSPNTALGKQVRAALVDSLARPMASENPDWIAHVILVDQGSLTRGTVRIKDGLDSKASQAIASFFLRSLSPQSVAQSASQAALSDGYVQSNTESKLHSAHLSPLPTPGGPWLSRLRVSKDRECAECVLASFKLLSTQDLLLFSTARGQVHPFNCSAPVQQRSAGEYKFRIRAKHSQVYARRPTGGFYVLSGHRDALESVAQLFQRSSCEPLPATQLSELIAAAENPSLRWQAIHFQKRGNTLVKL